MVLSAPLQTSWKEQLHPGEGSCRPGGRITSMQFSLAGWLKKVTVSVTLHLLGHFPVSQKEYTRSINWTSPDFFPQLPFWSCWGSAGSSGYRLAQIRATLVSGKVSRLLLLQSLDCALCYTSPALHLLVTLSPDTPTWLSRSSVYSLPSASQMFQLNQILQLHLSLKYAPFALL